MQVKVRALIWHGDQVIVAREETGLEIQVGRLLYVAECVNGYSLADVILIFTASATSEVDPERVELVHPDDAGTANVLAGQRLPAPERDRRLRTP